MGELFILILAIPFITGMSSNPPEYYSIITYMWVISFAMVGGLVSKIQDIRSNKRRNVELFSLIGEMLISGFCGTLVFFVCELFECPQLLTMFMIGMAGHLGTKCLVLLNKVFVKIIERWFGITQKDDDSEE